MSDTAETIDLAKSLKCQPKNVIDCLQVGLGTTVESNSVIAKKKSLIHTVIVHAPFKAKILSLTENGILKLSRVLENDDDKEPKHQKSDKPADEQDENSQPEKETEDNDQVIMTDSLKELFISRNKSGNDIDLQVKEKHLFCLYPFRKDLVYRAIALGAVSVTFLGKKKNKTSKSNYGIKVLQFDEDEISLREIEKLEGEKVQINQILKKIKK